MSKIHQHSSQDGDRRSLSVHLLDLNLHQELTHDRTAGNDVESQATAHLQRILDNLDGLVQASPQDEVLPSRRHDNPFTRHASRLTRWLGVFTVSSTESRHDQEQPLIRNVEDNIQRPIFGANLDDSTPWRQHDNALIRQPILFLRWLWFSVLGTILVYVFTIIGSIPMWYAQAHERAYLGIVRLLCLPLVHPVPVFLCSFVVVSAFLGFYVARGEFPALLLLADGFIIVTLGVLGRFASTNGASSRIEHY